MRAPPDPAELTAYKENGYDDSGSDTEVNDPVGAFPGTARDYTATPYY